MNLMLNGADLNNLNNHNCTPLSFGTEMFLKSLNLKDSVCYASDPKTVNIFKIG